jgi:SnoaL-like domain
VLARDPTDDVVARYCGASARKDMDALATTFTDDVILVSPISGSLVFRGRKDVGTLLTYVHSVLGPITWDIRVRDDHSALAVGQTRVGGIALSDAMLFELAPDGRIAVLRPHLRPWLGFSVFALLLGVRVVRHPQMLWRARAGRAAD